VTGVYYQNGIAQGGNGPDGGNLQDEERYRRHRDAAFLTRIDEVVEAERGRMPFFSWAAANRFPYTETSGRLYRQCGSAAEVYFLRPFAERDGLHVTDDGVGHVGDLSVALQVQCAKYRIDFVVSDPRTSLAIEIDGMAFHHRAKEQVAADYLRERRLVLKGHTVIRFTAQEVFADARECWRQVDAILSGRRKR
jgi:very-short-patch-repair endonuclease